MNQGQAERGEIIAAAQAEAERRLDKARLHIEARHREAWQKLRNEIIDSAVNKAKAELPHHVSPELEQTLLEQYLKSISDPHRKP